MTDLNTLLQRAAEWEKKTFPLEQRYIQISSFEEIENPIVKNLVQQAEEWRKKTYPLEQKYIQGEISAAEAFEQPLLPSPTPPSIEPPMEVDPLEDIKNPTVKGLLQEAEDWRRSTEEPMPSPSGQYIQAPKFSWNPTIQARKLGFMLKHYLGKSGQHQRQDAGVDFVEGLWSGISLGYHEPEKPPTYKTPFTLGNVVGSLAPFIFGIGTAEVGAQAGARAIPALQKFAQQFPRLWRAAKLGTGAAGVTGVSKMPEEASRPLEMAKSAAFMGTLGALTPPQANWLRKALTFSGLAMGEATLTGSEAPVEITGNRITDTGIFYLGLGLGLEMFGIGTEEKARGGRILETTRAEMEKVLGTRPGDVEAMLRGERPPEVLPKYKKEAVPFKPKGIAEKLFTEISRGERSWESLTQAERFMVTTAAKKSRIGVKQFFETLPTALPERIQEYSKLMPTGVYFKGTEQAVIFAGGEKTVYHENLHSLLTKEPTELLNTIKRMAVPSSVKSISTEETFIRAAETLKAQTRNWDYPQIEEYVHKTANTVLKTYPDISDALKKELITLSQASFFTPEETSAINKIGGMRNWVGIQNAAKKQNVELTYVPKQGFKAEHALGDAKYFPTVKDFITDFQEYLTNLKTSEHEIVPEFLQLGYILNKAKEQKGYNHWKPTEIKKTWSLQEIDELVKGLEYGLLVEPNLNISVIGPDGTKVKTGTLTQVGSWLENQLDIKPPSELFAMMDEIPLDLVPVKGGYTLRNLMSDEEVFARSPKEIQKVVQGWWDNHLNGGEMLPPGAPPTTLPPGMGPTNQRFGDVPLLEPAKLPYDRPGWVAASYLTTNFRDWSVSVEQKTGWPLYTKLFQPVFTGMTEARVHSEVHRRAIAKIFKGVPRKMNRVISMWLEAPIADKVKIAEEWKMPPRTLQAAKELRGLYDKLFEVFGLDARRYLEDYIPHIRRMGYDLQKAFPRGVPRELEFFAEYPRVYDDVPFREMDAHKLISYYLQKGMQKKYLGPYYTEVRKWLKDSEETMPNIVFEGGKRFLDDVMYRPTQTDLLIREAVDSIFEKIPGLGKLGHITTNRLVSVFMGLNYGSTMAWRTALVLRNLTQPFITVFPVVGGKNLGYGIMKALEIRDGKWLGFREARARGWTQRAVIPFEEQLKLEKFTRIGIAPYRMADELNRTISGFAFSKGMEDAVKLYWQGKKYKSLADAVNKGTGEWFSYVELEPVLRHLNGGNMDGAITEMGRLGAATTQWLYQTGAQAGVFRELGMVGKLAGMYGTWPINFKSWLAKLASRGAPAKRVLRLARWATAGYLINKIGEDLFGIRNRKWVFLGPLTYTGGPIVDFAIDIKDLLGGPSWIRAKAAKNLLRIPLSFIPGGSLLYWDIRRALKEDRWQDQVKRFLGFTPKEVEPEYHFERLGREENPLDRLLREAEEWRKSEQEQRR